MIAPAPSSAASAPPPGIAGPPCTIISAAPAGTVPAKASAESCSVPMRAGTRRLARSRAASAAAAKSASSEPVVNTSAPGRTTISTPANPAPSAAQRTGPTRSPKKSAAPSVTRSGEDCRIAETDESGSSASAVTKAAVPAASAAVRSATAGWSAPASSTRTPARRASPQKISAPQRPMASITCPEGMSALARLMNASSIANSAMPRTIRRMPRRFSIAPAPGAARAPLRPIARRAEGVRHPGALTPCGGCRRAPAGGP